MYQQILFTLRYHEKGKMKNSSRLFDTYGMGIIFIFLCIFFTTQSQYFLTGSNFANLLIHSSVNIVIATGMTFVICAAEIDLSVGSLLAFCGIITSLILKTDFHLGMNLPMWLTSVILTPVPDLFPGQLTWWFVSVSIFLILALLPGILAGALTGLIVVAFGVPSFIVTLGFMMVYRGLARYLTNANQIFGMPTSFMEVGSGWLTYGETKIIPYSILIAIVIVITGALILSRTRIGRHVLSVGGNDQASYLSGVSVKKVRFTVFIISGFCVSIAAIIQTSRLFIGDPNAGEGYELNAIAAVIIGGTSLFGGKGTVVGTLFGALIIGVLSNGLDLMQISDHIKQIVIGSMIIFAVLLDYLRRKFYQ